MTNIFNELPAVEPDRIMLANALWPEFKKAHPDAVNTTIGVLLDPLTNSPWRPESVQAARAAAMRHIDKHFKYGYQSPHGHDEFLQLAKRVVIDSDDSDILAYQVFGGTGALTLSNDILARLLRSDATRRRTLVLDPGYPNHLVIFGDDFHIVSYRHLDANGAYNHAEALEALSKAPNGAAVLLQVSSYNGDGVDRTTQQWDEIFDVAQQKELILVLDAAYLGLTGTIEADAYPIREAIKRGLFTFVNVAMSKNMGLYNERLGAVFIANAGRHLGKAQAENFDRIIRSVIRGSLSTPPLLVAEAAAITLKDPHFYEELKAARERLAANRKALVRMAGGALPVIAKGRGLFTTLFAGGFSEAQQEKLKREGIFVLPNSRINIGGMRLDQVERVGAALLKIL